MVSILRYDPSIVLTYCSMNSMVYIAIYGKNDINDSIIIINYICIAILLNIMSYVLHRIKDNSGRGEEKTYLYDHFRKGNTVVSRYISPISVTEYRRLKEIERVKQSKESKTVQKGKSATQHSQSLSSQRISYTTRARIYTTGYPVHNPDGSISVSWGKGHAYANRKQREKYPRETKEINKLSRTFPKDELMGKHTKSGKIIISERIPKHLREAISYHEKVEHEYMEKDK